MDKTWTQGIFSTWSDSSNTGSLVTQKVDNPKLGKSLFLKITWNLVGIVC